MNGSTYSEAPHCIFTLKENGGASEGRIKPRESKHGQHSGGTATNRTIRLNKCMFHRHKTKFNEVLKNLILANDEQAANALDAVSIGCFDVHNCLMTPVFVRCAERASSHVVRRRARQPPRHRLLPDRASGEWTGDQQSGHAMPGSKSPVIEIEI